MRLGQKILGHVKTLGKKVAKAGIVVGALLLGAKHAQNEYDKKQGYEGATKNMLDNKKKTYTKVVGDSVSSRVNQIGMSKGNARDLASTASLAQSVYTRKVASGKLEKTHQDARDRKAGREPAPDLNVKQQMKKKVKEKGKQARTRAKEKGKNARTRAKEKGKNARNRMKKKIMG